MVDLDVAEFALGEARAAAGEYLAEALGLDEESIPADVSTDVLVGMAQKVAGALEAAFDAGFGMGVLQGGADATILAEMDLDGGGDYADADAAVIDALVERMGEVAQRLDAIEMVVGLKFAP
jgi:hypothetical protein